MNTGVQAYPANFLNLYLPRVGNANTQGEFYLPDVLAMAVNDGHCVVALKADHADEVLGINDRSQLAEAEAIYRTREANRLMQEGVTLVDPSRVDIRGPLTCGRDVIIDINVVFEGDVHLEDGVRIGPNCVIRNSRIGAGCEIHAMSHIDEAQLEGRCSVGPYARLRPGTRLGEAARVGNFVETKKAHLGAGSKVNHLSYIGDAQMGAGVNIGAGTITCNYDGINKHQTTFGDGVFVGSNSTLVAPLTIGDGGFVGAGSTITAGVPEASLGVSRARQRNIDNWRTPKQRAEEQGN
ncbi:MAG: bifunctional UDP-N-acetylglucosamine diphosphorylase/glucosamine-1-phosphate N-acetyltransferase GlmU [Pseudomonadota bacterium]